MTDPTEPEGLLRTFRGKTQPYQDLVDRFKANVAADIRSFYKTVLLSQKAGKDLHTAYADCFARVRETNARALPQAPLVDKQLFATLCCYGHIEPFMEFFEKLKDVDPVDHNTPDGEDRITRMILLDTGDYIRAFADWINQEDRWKGKDESGKPLLHKIFHEDNNNIFRLLARERIGPKDWPDGIALHERINAALEKASLEKQADTHNTQHQRPSGPPKLKVV
ncbi:MAG: hypothetical protein H6867_02510 [Rhodospirillales bacterium]|nr:hypothetical protein [Rhodospirillales bacterium]MCB9997062.1 hypothetical protein [Rhodospirillales bacterium]